MESSNSSRQMETEDIVRKIAKIYIDYADIHLVGRSSWAICDACRENKHFLDLQHFKKYGCSYHCSRYRFSQLYDFIEEDLFPWIYDNTCKDFFARGNREEGNQMFSCGK